MTAIEVLEVVTAVALMVHPVRGQMAEERAHADHTQPEIIWTLERLRSSGSASRGRDIEDYIGRCDQKAAEDTDDRCLEHAEAAAYEAMTVVRSAVSVCGVGAVGTLLLLSLWS